MEGIKGPRRIIQGGMSKLGWQGKDMEEPRRRVNFYLWECIDVIAGPPMGFVSYLYLPVSFLLDRS